MDTNKKIKDSSMTDAVVAIAAVLTSSYQKLGYKFTEEYSLEEMSIDVFNTLLERHPNVTLEQINKAVSNGINGDYGEVKGLYPVDVVRFVKEYTTPKNVINYQAPEEKEPLLLERDRKADTINLMQSLYKSYLNNEPIYAFPPSGSFITLLWSHNLLLDVKNVMVQQKYIEQAKVAIRKEKEAMIGRNPHMAGTILKEIRDISEKDIKEKSYKLVILDFFKDCKDINIKDLHELFNN